MTSFKKLAIAGAIGLVGVAANASSMVFNFSGSINDLQIPDAYADLYDIWNSNADFNDFFGTVVVDNFESYAVGTHTLNIASSNSPIKLSLVSGILTGIEGTRNRQSGAFVPDDSQVGSSGALTIVDGVITGLTWNATGWQSDALKGFNERTFVNAGFPVVISSISLVIGGQGTTAIPLADGYFAQNVRGTGTVIMGAIPEPGTYAMFAAGLAGLGFVARRRRPAA